MLRAAQGAPDQALLDRLTAWADSDETELMTSYWGTVGVTRLAEHRDLYPRTSALSSPAAAHS